MPLNGLEIVHAVYRRLRRPSQTDLVWQDAIAIVGEVVSRMKVDLMLNPQNQTAVISDWFTVSETDLPLDAIGIHSCLLPVRVEKKAIDSEFETGFDVPCVNFEVLDTSIVGAVSFYGTPLRIAFRDALEVVSQSLYRIVYETDTVNDIALNTVTGLPQCFKSKATLMAAYEAMEIIENDTPSWLNFVKLYRPSWEAQMINNDVQWRRYVRIFRGKSQVPKRRFFDNRGSVGRVKFFNTK